MIRGVTKTEGSITVFHLRDDLDTQHVKAFTKKMQELIDSGRVNIVLELSHVKDICLLGLVSISSIFNKCRQAGGSLKIACLSSGAKEAFEESNLINTVEVHDSVLDGVKAFRSQNLLKSKSLTGSFYLHDRQSFVGWDRLPLGNYVH